MLKIVSTLLIAFLLTGCSSLLLKPESEWTVEDFYTKAKDELDAGQWNVAIEYYEKLKANFPYGELTEQAYLELAFAYYRYDEPLSAIREMEEFIRLYPKHPQLAYAHYLKALAADSINKSWLDQWITDPADRDAKSTQEAYLAYQAVIDRFPQSQYAAHSQQRLIIITNRLARQELKVAEYYFKRKAYLAAANRLNVLLENYPLAQSNKPALKLLKASYEALGMTQNAAAVQAVIDLNS